RSCMEIISRAEAKAKGLKFYFTGKPCKHGHVSERQLSNGCCTACTAGKSSENGKLYRERHAEKLRRKNAKYRAENKGLLAEKRAARRDSDLAVKAKYRQENKDLIREYQRAWYANNKDYARKYRELNRDAVKAAGAAWASQNRDKLAAKYARYTKRHSDKINAKTALRRSAKLAATPA